MQILSNVQSDDLSERLAAKHPRFFGFDEVSGSGTLSADAQYDGHCFLLSENIVITIEENGMPVGGVVRFVYIGNESAVVETSDTARPSSFVDLTPGGFVDCIWTGSMWVFVGVYTY